MNSPIGGFLDSFPSALFIAAHVIFIVAGFWAMQKSRANNQAFASLFWLYIITQLFFLGFLGGMITMKMAVLLEQILILIMVLGISMRKS